MVRDKPYRCMQHNRTARQLRALSHAREGIATIEFAFIAPVFFLLLMGIIEVSLVMFAQSVLEGAAFNASRTGRTGYVETNLTREQTIIAHLDSRAETLMDTSRIHIDTTVYQQFDQVGEPEPYIDANSNGQHDPGENYTDVNGNGQYDLDMGRVGLGSASQIVVYTITYPWPITTPVIGTMLGTGGTINLTARAVIQNEPY